MPFIGISYLELWQPFCPAERTHLCNLSRVYPEEQFCDFLLNLGQWFRRSCGLKDYLSGTLVALLFSGAEPFMQFWKRAIIGNIQPLCSVERNNLCNFGRGYQEEQFCEIILNLGQWFRRRCLLKDFLSGALATLLFSGAEPFMQFWKRASWGTFMWSYMKLSPVVQEMLFKEKVYARTDDGQRQITIAHLEPSARVS